MWRLFAPRITGIPRSRMMQLRVWDIRTLAEIGIPLDSFPIKYTFLYVYGTVKQKYLTRKLLTSKHIFIVKRKKHDESQSP